MNKNVFSNSYKSLVLFWFIVLIVVGYVRSCIVFRGIVDYFE